jgi:hypothetical protein
MRLVLVLFLSGCTTGYVGQNCPAQALDVSTEGSGTSCKPPTYFKGTLAPGEACTTSSQCAPLCCGCANGNGVALAQPSCISGKCGSNDETCCGYNQFSDICRRGPSSAFFKACEKDGDCASGLTCIRRYQVTLRDGQIGAVCEDGFQQQKICTKKCSADSECTAFNGACTGTDSCDGPKNLCFNK